MENFFGQVRQQGGNCDNPTPIQFTRAFRKLFMDNFLSPIPTGNCAEDFDVFLIKSQDVPNSITERPSQPPTVTATDTDFKTIEIEKKILTMNALTYVSGYLLTKCLTKHDCTSCNSILTSECIDDSSPLFTMFKEFDGCKLTIPKDSFVKHIL